MSKHTPGPWARNVNVRYPVYAESDHKKIAYVLHGGYDKPDEQEAEANLRLVAAAPELLDALKMIVALETGVFDDPALVKFGPLSVDGMDITRIAKNAIAKAEGN